MFQKLQQQHVAQQQQLQEQIQLLQQQQEMLRPGRVSREGTPEEPRELELSQGSASELSQSSSPSAHLKDPANGMVSPEPAVPVAAEGGCRGNGRAVRAAAQLRWEEVPDLLLDKHGPHKSRAQEMAR